MTLKVAITGTRTFTSDAAGMPVSRQLALAEQQEPQRRDQPASGDLGAAWLAATGVQAVDLKPPATLADAYLVATGAQADGETVEAAKPAGSTDPVGDAWLGMTAAGFAL